MDSIGKGRGGLTRAVFKRFLLASEGKRSILVTVAYQPDVLKIFKELKTEGWLPAHAELVNFHEDMRQTMLEGSVPIDTPWSTWESDSGLASVTESFTENYIQRFFQTGAFIGLICRGQDDKPRYADVHDPRRPWSRLYRDIFWPDGTLARRDHFDDSGAIRYRTYITADGHPYVSTWMTPAGYEYRSVDHTQNDGSALYKDMRYVNSAWLARILDDIGPSIVFTDEPRTTFALEIKNPSVRHITSIHTTHFVNNTDRSEGLKHWVEHYIKFKDNVSNFVLFTQAQRLDFIADAKVPEERVSVISHPAPGPGDNATLVPKGSPTLVSVGRLADEKRLEDAIQAFAKHCTGIPDARFRIYGLGPARARLLQLVDFLGVKDSVIFEGHTEEPLKAFAGATASVVASKHEGFGLVITESFAMGTPVVGYDVIYGPRDIIKNEFNGLLVDSGDIDALGKAMQRVLTDKSLQAHLRNGAVESALLYSQTNWERGWKRLVEAPANNLLAEVDG